jgi:hypothetical protein
MPTLSVQSNSCESLVLLGSMSGSLFSQNAVDEAEGESEVIVRVVRKE